jgi:cytidine deaminase
VDARAHRSLLEAARTALANSYAPYSQFAVGAAVVTDDGSVIGGCNVENASYGLTICAERVAIFNAIAQGKKRISAIAIANRLGESSVPCGACRQVMTEFATPELEVILQDRKGDLRVLRLADLLPEPFLPSSLPRPIR